MKTTPNATTAAKPPNRINTKNFLPLEAGMKGSAIVCLLQTTHNSATTSMLKQLPYQISPKEFPGKN
jgi:hypothetical protein